MISVRTRIGIGIGMCALVSLLGSNVVFAAEAPAADAPSLWKTLGFQISGGTSATYNHNFNNPDTNLSPLRTHDANTNTFTPNLAQVIVQRPATAGSATDRVGFRSRLNFGSDARYSRARTNYLPGTDNNEIDVQELYGEYIAPIGNGLLIQFGKINTALGNETFTSWENPNFSRTFNYNLAQAFTTTGVRVTYEVNPMVKLMTALSNGWDNIEDNNQGKLVEGALTLTLHPRFVNYFYVSWSQEQSNGRGGAGVNGAFGGIGFPGGQQFCSTSPGAIGAPGTPFCDRNAKRIVLDYIMTAKLTDMDTLIVEVHYWNETNASFNAGNPSGNQRVNAAIVYLNHDFNDQWALNTRAEVFEDAGGARVCTGGVNFNGGNNTCAVSGLNPGAPAFGTPQTLQSYTFTLQWKPAPALVTRTEFRHDRSNHNAFLDGDQARNNQSTLAFNVVYLF
jgi:hypothetical protein